MKPAEVIKRHYGDCKDKATLLVAMLRAAGIDADLALLSVGPGRDVKEDLPGINRFDHAIVYVPAAAGATTGHDAIWIDATAESFAVGYLPYDDEGRNALVIAAGTSGLTRTPEPKPEDSVLVETRTFKLAEMGPSSIEEVSETQGYIDATYRGDYGGPETPKIRQDMENYVKNAYLAKKLTRFEHGDGTDFEHPFKLTLAAEGARRGFSSLVDAEVVIFPTTTVNSLPKWFGQTPPVLGPDASEEQKKDMKLAVAARPASYAVRPYIYEMRARVLVPAGFELRSLPPNKTTPIGLGTLTETYSTDEPGVVKATFRFNSGPSKLTSDQALAMRDAVLELNKRDYVGVLFDQAGAKALTAGHIREALEIDRKLIAADPTDAVRHLHLSRALLDAGIGNEAQSEAKRATELDAKSAIAWGQYGWALEHNALGERFGKGFDLTGAIAALKKAIALDDDDDDPKMDLAILYEFDARGTRYAPDADLPAAIASYKALIEKNKAKGDQVVAQYRENLLYALLYAHKFAELDAMLATLPSTNAHRTLAISSAAAQHGAAAGIAQADKGTTAAADRNKNLRSAGTQLANLHLYKEAADVISAGMQGGDDAATAGRQIELYRGLKVAATEPLAATNPAAPVQASFVGLMAGTLTREQAEKVVTPHAYASKESMELDVSRAMSSVGFMKRVAEKSDMTESVLFDLIAGNTTFTAKGDDEHGWAVVAQTPGSDPTHTWVVKDDGAYRVVADSSSNPSGNAPVGNEVLWELAHGKAAAAKALLDWKRDLTHKGGGDDPFEGALLPRFWTIGSSKPGADSPEAMRLAAISLLAGTMDAKPYLTEIAAARDKATGLRQTDLDLLLALAAMGAEQPAIGMPAAKRLLDQEPDSDVALGLVGQGYLLTKDAKGWLAMLAPRLEKKPGDHDLLNAEVQAYQLAGDWKAAKAAGQKVLDSGKATANDYNNFAWMGLFHDDLGEDILKAALQSAQMGKNSGFAELHTLACIYAAQGKTTEARQVLDQAMYAGNVAEPNSSVWYALGLIYEQYGAKTAALDAYSRVQAHDLDDHTVIEPTSTYVLAQERLKALKN
jgi:tetratricopeptide (TPR) repeat protein